MKIAFFGSSILSAYRNGAATFYRGLIKALHGIGYQTVFYEPGLPERHQYVDMKESEWVQVRVYEPVFSSAHQMLEEASTADIIIKASGVGVLDAWLEAEVLALKRENNLVIYWDVEGPVTLKKLEDNPVDPFRLLIPQYDFILTNGGGRPVTRAYNRLGAKACYVIYNAADPAVHYPVAAEEQYRAGMIFMGNRLPDRETRIREFFFSVASRLPDKKFLLAGSGWEDIYLPSNVSYLGHLLTSDHNLLNTSAKTILNVSRHNMAAEGYSPSSRLFEAAAAGSCMVTDYWEGIDIFFEPGSEILVAHNGAEVAGLLEQLDDKKAAEMGEAALHRVHSSHTFTQRAKQVDEIFNHHFNNLLNPLWIIPV